MVILFSPVTLMVRNGFCWSSALPCWSKSASFIVSEEYHKGRKGLAEEPGVLVATHEERADHPLQDLLPFQASFQVPTCAGGLFLSASLQDGYGEANGYGEGLSEMATGSRRHFSS